MTLLQLYAKRASLLARKHYWSEEGRRFNRHAEDCHGKADTVQKLVEQNERDIEDLHAQHAQHPIDERHAFDDPQAHDWLAIADTIVEYFQPAHAEHCDCDGCAAVRMVKKQSAAVKGGQQ